jgi:hypothetical protein
MTRLSRLFVGALALLSIPVAALCYDADRGTGTTSAFPGLANATVLIVRHAEKPFDGNGLNAKGVARSKAYVAYFERFRIDGAPIHIDTLVAAADSPRSERPRLTLAPLSAATDIPIEQPAPDWAIGSLATWLATGQSGRTILIAWHHSEIPALVARLGADPGALFTFRHWSPTVFDDVVILRFDGQGRLEPGKTRLVRENIAV